MLPWAPDEKSLNRTPYERRLELEKQPDCKFVNRDEFIRLLTSQENLIRADEQRTGLRGLLDVRKNFRFLIEEEELFGESVAPRLHC